MVPGLGEIVDAVATPDVPRCLLLLCVASVDVTGIGAEPVVVQILSQLRDEGPVESTARGALVELSTQAEFLALDPRVDAGSREAAFRRARAMNCLYFASGASLGGLSDPVLREALRESSYEACAAMHGPAGVIGILCEYAT